MLLPVLNLYFRFSASLMWLVHDNSNTWWVYVTRKKDETKDSDFKDAAKACLPLINAALDDIVKGTFLRGCLLNIGVPSAPSANKLGGRHMPRNSQSCQAWHVISLQYLLVPCPPNQPSLGGRILGESRSSLTPEMLEALVCVEKIGCSRKRSRQSRSRSLWRSAN